MTTVDKSHELLDVLTPEVEETGIFIIRQMTSKPDTFVFEGSYQPLEPEFFEFPFSVYPLKIDDRYFVQPIVTADKTQRYAVLNKINGGAITRAKMDSPTSLKVDGVNKTFSASELIFPFYEAIDKERNEPDRIGINLIAGDLVGIMPVDVTEGDERKVKYMIVEKYMPGAW